MEINIWGTDLEPPLAIEPEQEMPENRDSDCPENQPARKSLLGLIIPLFLKPEQKAASDCN